MQTVSLQMPGTKLLWLVAGFAALCGFTWAAFTLSHVRLGGSGSTAWERHEAFSPSPAAAAGSNWFTSLFASHQAAPRQAALSQIEMAGFDFSADSFTRAVAARHAPVINAFLAAGMNVNAVGADGRSALLVAVMSENWPAMDLLLTRGADPNLAAPHGLRPIMAATLADQVGAIHALLSHGAKLDCVDDRGHTPLHYAVASRSIGAMEALLDAGAPCTAASCCEGHSDLATHAFETGDWRIVEPILTRETTRLKWSPPSRSLLAKALNAQDAAHTRLLLAHHSAAPTPEGSTQPLLAYALLRGDMTQFKFLLDCGADPNTPLNSPVEKTFNQSIVSEQLRDYLANEPGMNTLMLAASLGRTDFMRVLIDKGASRNQLTTRNKWPALQFAAEMNQAPAMQMLIAGAPNPEQLRIEISRAEQQASVIKSGVPIFTTEISTGKEGHETPSGDFVITDKALVHRSTIYKVDMPYFMRLNCRDFGMHQGYLPGYAASHGCIRMPKESAQKLYKEIPIGTLVTIR